MISTACALLAPLLLAQAEQAAAGGTATPASSLKADSLQPGAAVTVTGKYKEMLGADVTLYDCAVAFRITQDDLRRKVRQLQPQRDNVLLRGTVRTGDRAQPAGNESEAPPGLLVVVVEDLQKTAGDVEVFARLLEDSIAGRPGTPTLDELLRRIVISYQRFAEPELTDIHRKAFAQLLQSPAAGNVGTQALQALRELHASVGQKELTLELAQPLLKDPALEQPLTAFLQGIGCRKSRGTWMTHEAIKVKDGLVLSEGTWVQPREKHLAEILQRLNSSRQPLFVLRKRTDREYQRMAAKGAIEEGMKPEEASQALGFPDRVERRMFEDKELTQWSYGQNYCYFYDGLLFRPPEKS